MQEIDWSVGEIRRTLREYGLEENTLVLFTSDHGPWYQGSPGMLRGRKDTSYEGGCRVLSRHLSQLKLHILDDLPVFLGLWEPWACDLLFDIRRHTIDGPALHVVAFGLFPALLFDLWNPLSAIEDSPCCVGIEA